MKDQRIFCHDILDRIARIERYTAEGRAAFMESELLQDGVIRSFEIIGEALKRMEPTLLATRTDVIWSDFAGFRDVLIHQYEKVRLNLVWEFSQEDLPPLKAAILALLAMLPPDDERC